MGLRGPAKKPHHLKLIAGTAAPSEPEDAPLVAGEETLTELPPPPDYMPNEEAKAEWRKIGAVLIDRGALNGARLTPLAIYCALTGKIAQKFKAGDIPAAHLIAQHKSLAKDLGIIGANPTANDPTSAAGAPKGRLSRLKERARGTD